MAYEPRDTKSREHWLCMKRDALRKRASGEALTLEETAVAIWDPEHEAHPMTCMGVLKIEKRALEKLKAKLRESRITSIDDVIGAKFREVGEVH